MSSTFTAPIRVNTRQTTSNDGTISPDNTGAAVLTQQAAFVGGTATEVVLPAGSIIHLIQAYVSVAAGTPATATILLDGAPVATVSDDAGVNDATLTSVSVANTGPVNSVLSLTAGADAEGILSVMYTARNADGTIAPYGSGYTNN
jgi:hypothetical protein